MTVDRDTDRAYFESIPWCLELLQDPGFIPTPTFSRQYKESTEDALFAETLKTSDTIRACSSLYKRPDPSGIGQISELIMLVSLGYRVNGYPNLCHGGIVGTLVDEAMGMLLTVNKNLTSSPIRFATVTAYLHVTYLKPVRMFSLPYIKRPYKDRSQGLDEVLDFRIWTSRFTNISECGLSLQTVPSHESNFSRED